MVILESPLILMGNLYIAHALDNLVLEVSSATGVITVVADGVRTRARMDWEMAVRRPRATERFECAISQSRL